MTINDIDTLSVYKEQQHTAFIKKNEAAVITDSSNSVEDTTAETLQSKSPQIILKTWTICAGVFREKNNAIRMSEQLSHFQNTYILLRDSSFFVTIGSFTTRDSAQQFRKNKALSATYLMKLKPKELIIRQTE